MKIIYQGQSPVDVPIRATCRYCRTVFEFHLHEAERVSDPRDGDFYRINCPVCNKTISKAVKA